MDPNLFSFATSELSQDAFLCWLLSWADAQWASIKPALHRVGTHFLKAIYSKACIPFPTQSINIDIRPQEAHIDILCFVNRDTAIIIEDKVGTKEHDGQLARYINYVSNKYTLEKERIISIYIQTGDQSDYKNVNNSEYLVFKRRDLLEILECPAGKTASKESDIFANFSIHLRKIEEDVESYAKLPLAEWKPRGSSWIGFYTKLQKELGYGNWDYVANPSGGFLGFHWWWKGDANCWQYLQLEEKRFCFKILVSDKSMRAERRDFWSRKIVEECARCGLKAKKPDRFGNGECMTVAILDQEYRSCDDKGLLDLSGTLSLIHKAELILDCACALPV